MSPAGLFKTNITPKYEIVWPKTIVKIQLSHNWRSIRHSAFIYQLYFKLVSNNIPSMHGIRGFKMDKLDNGSKGQPIAISMHKKGSGQGDLAKTFFVFKGSMLKINAKTILV